MTFQYKDKSKTYEKLIESRFIMVARCPATGERE